MTEGDGGKALYNGAGSAAKPSGRQEIDLHLHVSG